MTVEPWILTYISNISIIYLFLNLSIWGYICLILAMERHVSSIM